MRAHHGIAVIAVVLTALGAKLYFLPAGVAEADAVSRVDMNVLQMHKDHPHIKDLPVQRLHDMTFVFSVGD